MESQDLRARRPDYARLRAAALKSNQVSSFKIHAIAPDRTCKNSGEGVGDKAYYTAADASGGAKLDGCASTDYVPFLKSMIEKGSTVTEPTFRLGKAAAAILSVKVDGAETKDYQLSADGLVVTLAKVDAVKKHAVEITYRLK
jgi:hypothetical protein